MPLYATIRGRESRPGAGGYQRLTWRNVFGLVADYLWRTDRARLRPLLEGHAGTSPGGSTPPAAMESTTEEADPPTSGRRVTSKVEARIVRRTVLNPRQGACPLYRRGPETAPWR